jgi:3-deoxy-manno-octulosonate cytidylyltransferase (CMP-KDO synthetase)
MDQKVACVIPARYNSSRFPGKLLAPARGKTVLQRSYEAARSAFAQNEVFIATDDERIAAHARQIGARVVMTSPQCASGTDRIAEAVQTTASLQQFEWILNLQGDHPCTSRETIISVVDLAIRSGAPLTTAATPLRHRDDFLSPHIVKVVLNEQGRALYFSRAPIPYTRPESPLEALQHVGIYCYRKEFLLEFSRKAQSPLQLKEDLEQLRALEMGAWIAVALIEERVFGVDTPPDLAKLEEVLCQ